MILDTHPRIACGPELKVIPALAKLWLEFQTAHRPVLESYHLSEAEVNRLFARLIAELLDSYRLKAGKPRVAEKSPNNVFYFPHLHVLFPESPLVHVIRDGRDVVCSLLSMNWVESVTGEPLTYTRSAAAAAAYWAEAVRSGRKLLENEDSRRRYLELRYEDVVNRPEETLRALFEFIEEPWDAEVLEYHRHKRDLAGESSAEQVARKLYTSAAGRWERDLRLEDKDAVKAAAGDLLVELGYAADQDW